MVRNNSIIETNTPITFNIRSRVGGLVRMEKKKKRLNYKYFLGISIFLAKWISSSIEESRASFVEVNINGLIGDFLRIDPTKSRISYIRKRNDPSGSEWISDNESDQININPFFPISFQKKIQQSHIQNHETIHVLLNRNTECQFLIILSSYDYFEIGPFSNVKYYNELKIKKRIKKIKKDPQIPIKNSLGPVGIALQVSNFYSVYLLITHNQISMNKNWKLDKLKKTCQALKKILMDETEIIYKPDPCSNIKLNTFRLNWNFLHHDYDSKYCEKMITIISLGQFICENVCLSQTKNGLELKLKSGQVLIVKMGSILIRSANTYLATPGATVHGHFGEIFFEGDILVTFIYEK
ncbi:hypothetical protein AHAS_Ahas17G0290200 [Arachis hypogaea]